MKTYVCEHCGAEYHRASGDEGRGRFCSIRCGRAVQPMASREERFWSKVAKGEGCWEWQGARYATGYGIFNHNGCNRFASRLAWEFANDTKAPKGMVVRHKCDNPPCCRPSHLEIGTHKQNTQDAKARGRLAAGERHGMAKLTQANVETIRNAYAFGGITATDLAAVHGVTVGHISDVVRGMVWPAAGGPIVGKNWHYERRRLFRELGEIDAPEGKIPVLLVVENVGPGYRPRRIAVLDWSQWLGLHQGEAG